LIELAILGLLTEQDLHGYELKKRLRELLGPLSSVSFGSLYPALAKLERTGAVQAVEAGEDDQGRRRTPMPATGSLTGEAAAFRAGRLRVGPGRRARKVYGITPLGVERLTELLAEPADDDRSFALKLAFCRHLAPDDRLTVFERRRAQLVERLAETRKTVRARGERIDGYVRSLIQHDQDRTQGDIAWLDSLIEAERADARNREVTNRAHGGKSA